MLSGGTNNKHDATSCIGLSHRRSARQKTKLNDKKADKNASQPLTLAAGFDNPEVFCKFNHQTIIVKYQLSVAKAVIANKQQP